MNIEIQDDLYQQAVAFLEEKNKMYGEKNVCHTPESYLNRIIGKFFRQKEARKNNPPAAELNRGDTWVKFIRKNYLQVWRNGKGCCTYCGKKLCLNTVTYDHMIPPLRGGKNIIKNITTSCKWCNQDKGILTHEEYQYKQLHNAAQGIYPPK